jgi:hypothetical protein
MHFGTSKGRTRAISRILREPLVGEAHRLVGHLPVMEVGPVGHLPVMEVGPVGSRFVS